MAKFRACTVAAVFVTAFLFSIQSTRGAVPDYKLGDVAAEDVVTPLPLLVVNPEATDLLKQKVAQQVAFVVRHTPQSASEAEAELREKVAIARKIFQEAMERAFVGRPPGEIDLTSAAYTRTLLVVAHESAKDLPLDKLAPLWAKGFSDAAFVNSLAKPLRDVMGQPIVNAKTDSTFPPNQPVRLLPVKSATESPTQKELEDPGTSVAAARIITLWRARRLVETAFAGGQEDLGKFAAAFVRTNAYPDPELTEILRAKRKEGVTVNDTYDAAEVIVRKGQVIDRKALSALAVLREKSLIGTLQTKLEQEKSIAGQITHQTKWIAAALAVVGLGLTLIFWRLRAQPSTALVALPGGNRLLAGNEQRTLPAGANDAGWRERAMVAEGKADRAHEAIRTGVLGWMRERIVQTLFSQRAELLSVQQRAEVEMQELEQRLEQLHTPLQERISAYEKRIQELEEDLAVMGEENRELIGARISVAKQQLTAERERRRFGAN